MTHINSILLTAPMFQAQGGWVLDTQFVTTMGMPYLLAHGLGCPVEDARIPFSAGEAGEYRLFVYTYNWVAAWHPDMAPGVFDVYLDGRKTGPVFGCHTPQWGWESGGTVFLEEGAHELRLHDLTGFEGRVGMILLTKEVSPGLPATAEEVRQFVFEHTCTREDAAKIFDLVVCGGGMAGICAALSASRNGLKTALIQDREVVGGNNSSEVRVWLGGKTNFDPFPGIGNIMNEMEQSKAAHHGSSNIGENYEDAKKLALLQAEPNLTLYLGSILTDAGMEGDSIRSVTAWDYRSGIVRTIRGRLFADCTGDATLGFLAGADFEVTTNAHMGASNLWYAEEFPEPQPFPGCPWAIDLKHAPFPGRTGVPIYGIEGLDAMGGWFWESGHEHDPIEKAEYIRDLNFRAMYGAWDAVKNTDGDYPNHRLTFCAYIAGKRESRRLLGDVVLTKQDVQKGRYQEDGCVPSTWSFDVHYPDRRFYSAFHEGDAFIAGAYYEQFPEPYFVPYRVLYSRNVANLFMAGRNVSVSHDALGTVRVMRTGGMMGEVVGYAAKYCKQYTCLPRQVYAEHLEEFIAELKAIPNLKRNKLVANEAE